MRYDLVVVGTDGSATARPAEEVAIAVARAAGGEVLFVSAFQGDDGRHSAEQAVEEALARALAAGGKARTEVAEGEPAAVIMEVADRSDAKLVVVDDAGMGERRRLRLGGTADRISHSMPCDTLIVRTASAERSEDRVAYRKVLLATDGSSTATHAVRVGTELARGMSAAIEIVHVKDEVMGAVMVGPASMLTGPVSSRAVTSAVNNAAVSRAELRSAVVSLPVMMVPGRECGRSADEDRGQQRAPAAAEAASESSLIHGRSPP